MYGTQTWYKECEVKRVFENDVKMYGTQTATKLEGLHISLRMM